MSTKLTSSLVRHLAFAAAVFSFMGSAHAVTEAQFAPAHGLFMQATMGDSSALDKAADAFDALLKAEPANPVLMAYVGSMTSMKATTTALPWKKMRYAEDGMALLDKALALLNPSHDTTLLNGTPNSLDVRFTAASTFLSVPAFMNRAARGSKLLGEVLSSPSFEKAPIGFKAAVWMRAAKVAASEKRTDDARKYLHQVISTNAPQAEAAKAQLAAL